MAKVQLLEFVCLDSLSKLPIIRIHEDNVTAIIQVSEIQNLMVCGEHPNPQAYGSDHFMVLPWPRRL